MEEKKAIKVSLSTVLLIIAIIVIIIMAYYIYIEKTNSNKEISELEANVSNMQNTIDDLQGKMDSISNTINSGKTNTIDDSNNYKDDNKQHSKETQNLKLGNYTVNKIYVNKEDGHSNEECGITLKENNNFYIYMGWGAGLTGTYEITGKSLICNATTRTDELEEGKYNRSTNVIVRFKIINDNKLELVSIDINDSNTDKLIYSEGLEEGMTYSIK